MLTREKVERLSLYWLKVRAESEEAKNVKRQKFSHDMFVFCAEVEHMMSEGWGGVEAENYSLKKRVEQLLVDYRKLEMLYRSRGGDPSLVDSVGDLRTAEKYFFP